MKRLAGFLFLILSLSLHAEEKPRLLVVISVDQMRYDYLVRFRPWFVEDGFNRFLDRGATYTNAMYTYGVTYTGPGHATIGSGREPYQTGIIGNLWFERKSAFDTGMWDWYFDDSAPYDAPGTAPTPATVPDTSWVRELELNPRYCAYDQSVTVSAGKTAGMSPRFLLTADGLGDEIKRANPQSRVIGVTLKERSGILMSGRSADAVYWLDTDLPGFISSNWYRYNPEAFAFNERLDSYLPESREWNLSGIIPEPELEKITYDPPAAWPLKRNRYGTSFPHPVPTVKALTYTPAGNDLLIDFATHVMNVERLGTDDATDVLFMSFSTTDYIGHDYGPDSREAAEGMVLLDRSLARFFSVLDERLPGGYAVALTADHGIQHNPLIMKLRDPAADTGRFDLRNAPSNAKFMWELPPRRLEIERRAAKRLRLPFDERAPISNSLIAYFEEPGFYLNTKRLTKLRLSHRRVARAIRDVVRGMKSDGVDSAWTAHEFRKKRRGRTEAERLMRRSFAAERSPDVIIALRPGWMWGWGVYSTSHGQPVPDDRHVPLLFWGEQFKPGIYEAAASPLDLARTMAAIAGVDAGGPDSRKLECVK